MEEPIHIQANEDISQQIMMLDQSQKDDALLQAAGVIRGAGASSRVLVFVAMRKHCDAVVRGLRKRGEREDALTEFRSGQASVLVATDVAARGLDIKGVTLVVPLGQHLPYELSSSL
eukprot:Skav205898  [mRNA]  locus=scaffold123:235741:238469:+ [translate_table: standard]